MRLYSRCEIFIVDILVFNLCILMIMMCVFGCNVGWRELRIELVFFGRCKFGF